MPSGWLSYSLSVYHRPLVAKGIDFQIQRFSEVSVRFFKGELRPEISLLHMKVLTLIKAKSNVFL